MEIRVQPPKPHDGQRKVISEAKRFNVVCCGRRWGKTILGINRLVPQAINGFPVAYFCPTYKNLSETWREVVKILKPITVASNATDHRIELVTGGVIEMWSLSEGGDVARGRKYKRVVIDEAAMVADLKEIWEAVIRPTLIDYRGDAWFLSTPRGFNFFREAWQKGQDPTDTEWKSWQMPSSSNPKLPPEEIESMRKDMSSRLFAQESLAQFLQDGGGVFRNVRGCAVISEPLAPVEGHQYIIGCDWGRTNDATVFVVMDVQTKATVYIDSMTDTDFALQRTRLIALAKRYRDALVIAESNSIGLPQIESLQRDGLRVQQFITTGATKMQVIDKLVLAFETNEIAILNDEILIRQLEAYESERLPSGAIRYGAPSSEHDDYVIALAIAWNGVSRPPFILFEA